MNRRFHAGVVWPYRAAATFRRSRWPPVRISALFRSSRLNWAAIGIFALFVLGTLGITYRAAMQTKSAADFYAAGGGITGFQNGLAIAGDYMSAASFLGISGLVFTSGFDGLIYSIGFLVGWPVVLFLIAERLRNLGKLHLRRCCLVPPRPDADPHPVGDRDPGGRRVLSDRPDGRRRQADPVAVRPRLSLRGQSSSASS